MANPNNQTSSPAVTLALARAMQRVAEKHEDPDLLKLAQEDERQALADLENLRKS